MAITKTKEHPILFNTEMVKAILEGGKTQTRRVIVAQTGEWKGKQPIDVLPLGLMKIPNEWVGLMQHDPNRGQVFKCRYGQPGDRLWVKETHYIDLPLRDNVLRAIFKDGSEKFTTGEYIANYCDVRGLKWRPSIFMPKWAARIWLEITKVKVERLQEITEEDAKAEGCPSIMLRGKNGQLFDGVIPTFWFEEKWDSLNAKRKVDLTTNLDTIYPYSWRANPWVWVIEFRKLDV